MLAPWLGEGGWEGLDVDKGLMRGDVAVAAPALGAVVVATGTGAAPVVPTCWRLVSYW